MFFSWPSFDALPFKVFPLISWFAYVPLFLFVRKKSLKEVYFYTFITGLVGSYLSYRWIGHFGANVPGGPVVIEIFLMPLLAMYFGLKIFIAEALSRRFPFLRLASSVHRCGIPKSLSIGKTIPQRCIPSVLLFMKRILAWRRKIPRSEAIRNFRNMSCRVLLPAATIHCS